jgi:thiamine biosynthesis lipoprotein
MNCSFYVGISNSKISDWKSPVISFLQYINSEFSRFRTDNELWRFNEEKNETIVDCSPVFYDVLRKAEEYRMKTENRFSPYMLAYLENHGYSESFPFTMARNEWTKETFQTETEPLIFLKDGKILKKTNQKIDLGGIAKGYAVQAVSKWLQEHAQCEFGIVDGGGDISAWSNGEKTWKIGVMDPYDEKREIGSFQIQNGGIATSNIIYRSWTQGQTKKHHLLDGRTGMPVKSEIVQATVVTENCLDAEISAKICFMDEITAIKNVLNQVNKKFNYVLVKSNRELEMGGVKNEF